MGKSVDGGRRRMKGKVGRRGEGGAPNLQFFFWVGMMRKQTPNTKRVGGNVQFSIFRSLPSFEILTGTRRARERWGVCLVRAFLFFFLLKKPRLPLLIRKNKQTNDNPNNKTKHFAATTKVERLSFMTRLPSGRNEF